MSQLSLSPGVYVEEVSQFYPALGAASYTVPVLLTSAGSNWWYEQQQPVLIGSLEDFFALESANSGNVGSLEALALRAYFANGGTACYVCPTDQLEQIEALSDVSLVVQAGQPVEVIAGILNLCQPGSGRFALLDGPQHRGFYSPERLHDFLGKISPTASAALYYPWLNARWALQDNSVGTYAVPPSAVAAGLVMKTDSASGPWTAPGNLPLSSGLKPQVAVGNSAQQAFTSREFIAPSVNMFREFPDRGAVLLGARTLTNSGPAWGYINVRRTFDRVERDLQQAMQRFLFEPNGPASWEALRAAVEHYLYGLFRQQAFAGRSPQTSYRIDIGLGSTMTQQDILAGVMRMRIGLAVVKPAEFVFLEFSQLLGGASLAGEVGLPEPKPVLRKKKFTLSSSQIEEWAKPQSGVLVGMGANLALAGNGKHLIVSGSSSDRNVAHYIFEFNGNNWASDSGRSESAYKGRSLAMNYDGDFYVIGISQRYSSNDGTVAFFNPERGGSFASDSNSNEKVSIPSLGHSVTSNFNGDIIAVGAPKAKVGSITSGSVFITHYYDDRWSEIEDYTINIGDEGENNDGFGECVLLNNAGDKLIISAIKHENNGAVFTWHHINDSWVRDEQTLSNDAISSNFGQSFAINGEGSLLAISAPNIDDRKGSVYLYKWVDRGWEKQTTIIPDKENIKYFGRQVKLSSDGEILVISFQVRKEIGGDFVGGVMLYQYFDGEYIKMQEFFSEGKVEGYQFGEAIDLSSDGNLLVVGEPSFPLPNADDGSAQSGWIYFYDLVG